MWISKDKYLDLKGQIVYLQNDYYALAQKMYLLLDELGYEFTEQPRAIKITKKGPSEN